MPVATARRPVVARGIPDCVHPFVYHWGVFGMAHVDAVYAAAVTKGTPVGYVFEMTVEVSVEEAVTTLELLVELTTEMMVVVTTLVVLETRPAEDSAICGIDDDEEEMGVPRVRFILLQA